jgi:tol-pal system protein YbgF
MRKGEARMVFLVARTTIASLFRSMRSRLMLGVCVAAIGGSCAHAPEPPSAETPTTEPAIARLRQENHALKRRVQMLEDRVLMLEGGPQPVTSARRAPPPDRTREQAPRAHAASPTAAPVRRSISLDPLPNSGHPAPDLMEDPPTWEDDEQPWSSGTPDTSRSYRLVGAHLVEQTKRKGPARPDRPRRDAQGRGIVAEYEAAMAIYKSGDFVRAEQAFDAFARAHPDHDYADNALYWKGEAAYDQQHYADALAAFTEVVERYGGGNKAPDALLKIGLCYVKVGDLANARDVLTELVAAYPRARATDIARARLVELGA